jgi:hypothetical protein
MEQMIRIIGALAFVVIGIAMWMGVAFKFEPTEPIPFRSPILALELIRAVDDVKKIVGDLGDPNREVVRKSLRADFGFIVAYWLLFVALSVLLTWCDRPSALWLGLVAGIAATAAAGFDVLENVRISHVLNVTLAQTMLSMVNAVRHAALVKWALIFVAMALLAPLFFWRNDWIVLVGSLFSLTAVIGLVGLWNDRAIEWAGYPMAVGLVLVAFLFTFWPNVFVEGSCLSRN